MAPSSLEDLQTFARRAAAGRHDAASARALDAALAEYLPRRGEPLAGYRLTADGHPYPTFYAALADSAATFASGEVELVDPPGPGAAWEYLEPFRKLTFAPDGSATLFAPEGERTTRAMLRVLVREHYAPPKLSGLAEARRDRRPRRPRTQLATLAQGVSFLRSTSLVPFGVALLLYLPGERVRLEVDLVGDQVLRDPRAGRLAPGRRVRRSARVAHSVDEFVARGELSVQTARALEVLSEAHGMSAVELSQVFGGVRELAQSALQSLTDRRLAAFDRRTGLYRPRLDAFLKPADRLGVEAESLPPMPNPALRSSVMELLAAADSRATCPLCGDTLPPGHRGILCDRCQAEVGSPEASS